MKEPDRIHQNIFFSVIDGLILVSPSLSVLHSNLAIEDMFHKSRDAIANRPLEELFPRQPQILEKVRKVLITGTCYHDVEANGARKSATIRFPVNLTLSPYLESDDTIRGVIILIKNMSLIRELEEQQRPADHLNNLGALAMGLAHEIRNPLGGIRGSAQLLHQDIRKTAHREYLEVVINEVDRINLLVKRMMDLARPIELKLKETNIHKVLEDIIILEKETFARKNGRFQQVYDPSLPLIEADEAQLKQVFLNLIKNAIEASRDGGTLQIVTRVSSGFAIKTPTASVPRNNIAVEIIDSGEGMDEETQKKLFTPFHTTKSKGSGLGLPISLKIVEDHHGKIKITSEKGLGTTVQVFLPIRQR
jgi:two-component system, NtrC family, nitrogen regulation sensor histidine kinase GlnL